jgi:hypothetical protein
MPGSRIPGALGFGANQPVIDSGTSALTNMPVPGPVGGGAAVPSAGVTPVGGSRTMAAGEIAMSRLIFKDSVDYTRVKVHKGGFFGRLQSKRTAVTPNGEIYFNPVDFLEDYSGASADNQHWFIHEMVHVWQYQLGYPVKVYGLFSFLANYASVLTPEKRLSDFSMEQQGDIIADYYLLKVARTKRGLRNSRYADNLPLFEESILVDFLADPSSKLNLPKAGENGPSSGAS